MESPQPFTTTPKRHRLPSPWSIAGLLFLIAGVPALCAQGSRLFATEPTTSAPLIPAAAIDVPPSSLDASAVSSAAATAGLPEAPQAQAGRWPGDGVGRQFGDPSPAKGTSPSQRIAQKNATFIPYNWHAQPLSAHDKILLGANDLYSFDNFAAMFLSSAYSHVLNGEPNYGADKGAFGQRLGAAAIRETTQGIFTDMVFAPLLHEDTRYYAEGPNVNPVHRTLYAITRPLITRKDNGGTTVNGALLLGYAASAALTPVFYPSLNRNFHDTAATYGASVGGAALGFFISEVSNDVFYKLHLRRTP